MPGIGIGIDISIGTQQAFSPMAITDLIAWYDAAKGITLNGADVSQWDDQSGNGNDLSQGTAADQPLFNSSDANFNNQPSLTFDGVSEWINRVTFNGGSISQPNTLFLVYKLADLVGSQISLDGGASGTRNALESIGSNFSMIAGGSSQTVFTSDTNTHVLAALFNQASSIAWIDGTPSPAPATPGSNVMNGLSLGAFPIPAAFFAGEIVEVIIYDKQIFPTELNLAGNFLSSKHGTIWTNI